MDTSTPTGKAMLQMMSVIAELGEEFISRACKRRNNCKQETWRKYWKTKIPQEKLNLAMRMYDSGDYSIKEILESTTISQGTLYRENK